VAEARAEAAAEEEKKGAAAAEAEPPEEAARRAGEASRCAKAAPGARGPVPR
jgi:hypothetical protein